MIDLETALDSVEALVKYVLEIKSPVIAYQVLQDYCDNADEVFEVLFQSKDSGSRRAGAIKDQLDEIFERFSGDRN